MATYTSNFGLTKPDYGETADIAVINGNTDEIDEIMHDNRYMMADAWSSSVSYAVGDLCIYENALYKCVTATSGNWDASCWEATTLSENLGGTPEVSKTATGNPIELTDAASAPMVRCVTEIQGYQEGSGTPSPDNIRPIVAYTEGGVSVHGKNLFDKNAAGIAVDKYLNHNAGSLRDSNSGWNTSDYIPVIGGETLTISGIGTSQSSEWCAYDSNKVFISGVTSQNRTYTVPLNARYIRVDYKRSNTSTVQVEAGSSATAFEPFTGNTTYTTTYPTAIYRGSEDVAEGSVTSEWVVVDLSTLTWTAETWGSGDDFYTYDLMNTIKNPSTVSEIADIVCENYESVSRDTLYSSTNDGIAVMANGAVKIRDSRFHIADINDFISSLSGVKLAYRLATPTTTTVTVSNAPIRTLSGYTHIASTTGDMEVEYITKEYEPIVKALEH